jgi:hypothetical protein
VWCGLALGLANGSDLYKRGLITKEGGHEAMDHYFHQVSRTPPAEGDAGSSTSTNTERSKA